MNQKYGQELLPFIRNIIDSALDNITHEVTLENAYSAEGASFVTLTINEELRGCMGTLEAYRPLLEDIRKNSLAAAFNDPRFPEMTLKEFQKTRCELSILTPLKEISFAGKEDLIGQITPFKDGLLIRSDHYRSTFLPQVWEHYPSIEDFFFYLKLKAGLPGQFPLEKLRVWKYQVDKWKE